MENEKNTNQVVESTTEVQPKEEPKKEPTKEKEYDNMVIYNEFKTVPEEAKREILGGKLKGFTDINPMWRIKRLTEMFGPCGIGWKAPIVEKWTENGAGGEVICNVKIEFYYKEKGSKEWQGPIEGIGGSMLVVTENAKLRSNDEAYKMAYTDAISVACKMLGGGADVYYEKDRTKYDAEGDDSTPKGNKSQPKQQAQKTQQNNKTKYQIAKDLINGTSIRFSDVEDWCKAKTGNTRINEMPDDLFNKMITAIKAKIDKEKQENGTPWDE